MASRSSGNAGSLPPGFDINAVMAALLAEPGSAAASALNVRRVVSLNPLLNAAANDDVDEARCARGRRYAGRARACVAQSCT